MPSLPVGGLGISNNPRLVVRGYGGRPTLPVYIEGETFWDLLRRYLQLCPALASLTDIYFWSSKPGFQYPFMVVSPVGEVPELNSSESYMETADVQFAVVTSGPKCDVDAENLGQAAYRWLAPKMLNDAGVVVERPKLVSTYANESTALPGRKFRAAQPGRGPGNQNVFAFYFNYRFLLTRSMVVPAGG